MIKSTDFESGTKPTKQTNPKTKVVFLYISNEQVEFETLNVMPFRLAP